MTEERQPNTELLIAAAPELLAALEAAIPILHWATLHGSRCDEVIVQAQTAVSNAILGENAGRDVKPPRVG